MSIWEKAKKIKSMLKQKKKATKSWGWEIEKVRQVRKRAKCKGEMWGRKKMKARNNMG